MACILATRFCGTCVHVWVQKRHQPDRWFPTSVVDSFCEKSRNPPFLVAAQWLVACSQGMHEPTQALYGSRQCHRKERGQNRTTQHPIFRRVKLVRFPRFGRVQAKPLPISDCSLKLVVDRLRACASTARQIRAHTCVVCIVAHPLHDAGDFLRQRTVPQSGRLSWPLDLGPSRSGL